MKTMPSAAQRGDAVTINEHVDYEKMWERFKGQMSAMMDEQMGRGGNMSGAESFGAMLGLAPVDQFVEALVRPEVVMLAMKSDELKPSVGGDGVSAEDGGKDVRWGIERAGFNRVIGYVMEVKCKLVVLSEFRTGTLAVKAIMDVPS